MILIVDDVTMFKDTQDDRKEKVGIALTEEKKETNYKKYRIRKK